MNAIPAPVVSRGLRNNNPGNLTHSSQFRWAGELLPPDGPYCRFDMVHNGLRALAKTLWSYWTRDDCKSIRAIIGRFAPPNENDTAAYIADVSAAVGIHADDDLNIRDPEIVSDLMRAIAKHECKMPGVTWVDPFSIVQIRSAIRDAGCWKV